MQRAEVILSLLSQKARENPSYRFRRLYRHFFNPDFYRIALKQLPVAQPIKPTYTAIVESIIQQMRNERFRFAPAGSWRQQQRTNSLLSLEERLVAQIIGQLISAIYPSPMPTQQSALLQVQRITGVNWLVGGRLPVQLNKKQHGLCLERAMQRIEDGRFLALIRQMLDAGVWQSMATDEAEPSFLCQPLYYSLDQAMGDYLAHLLADGRLNYIRWGADLLIGVKGRKAMAQDVLDKLRTLLYQEFRFAVSSERLRLAHLQEKKRIRFMGYEIGRDDSNPARIQLLVPHAVIQEKIRPFQREGKPVHHPARLHLSVPALVEAYAKEMDALSQSYRYAADARVKLKKFRYYHYGSLLKTIASKEKSSVKQVLNKYGTNIGGNRRTIAVKEGGRWIAYLHRPVVSEEGLRATGEPDTSKGVCPVRRGADRNRSATDEALSVYPTKQPRQSI